MNQEQWTAVDDYFDSLFAPHDAVLDATIQATQDADMILMNVAPNQGKLLYALAKTVRARSILEVGTLAGYSTIWLARALERGGCVVTLEVDPKHAAVAQSNLDNAGLTDTVEVMVGSAHDTLPTLVDHAAAPFDLVFIDADKASSPTYLEWAVKLTKPGSLIIIDNVVRGGKVSDATSEDANVQGVRRALEMMANDPRLVATALQTVGSKGYDGFAMAVVIA